MEYVKRRRLTSFVLLGFLLVIAGLVAGCGQQEVADKTENKQLSGTITVAGSTSVQPFSDVLAEEFIKNHPGVQIDVQGGGSSQGIQATVSGAADIGASSRELKPEEKSQGLVETTIALDGIAIIVHPSNSVSDITVEDLRNIYLGNIKNWKELGGKDSPITVVCREAGSGTRGAFEELIMNKENISNQVVIQPSTGAVKTTVAGDEKAIGFVSMASVDKDVKTLKIDGVEASVANVKNGSYKISRPFLYLTKGEAQGLTQAFIDFVLSDEGQAVIQEEGAITVK
ncbi:MAG: phosphate ABC transporter substrate-binding protein [Syntrophomonadaceae bacterium]|nr:phosphate ABC transporter substrate-binding protein [Syntrophomonadaceae bacterium]